jgi:bacteriorhodopsin
VNLQIVQAFFMLGFVAMAAGTFYFVLERGDLKPERRSVATYAAVITLVASILYYVMKDTVKFAVGTATSADIAATVPLRYIDWLITTPLLLVEFAVIAALVGTVKKGLLSRLVIADVVMIATGYLGEISAPGSAAAWIYFIVSSLAWVYIIVQVRGVSTTGGPLAVQRAVKQMRWFVIAGWAIYPIGTALQQFLTLGGQDAALAISVAAMIFVIADVVNKVGFGIIAVRAARQN